jgi:hypothetical protein
MEARYNAWESGARSTSSPIEVAVLLRVGSHELSIRGDNVECGNLLACPTPILSESAWVLW